MASTRLTIYLLDEDVVEPSDVLKPDKTPSAVELDPESGLDGAFFYASRPARPPTWVSFVTPLLATPLQNVLASSASGLLILRSSSRFFAITFGYGRGLLDLSRIEHRFGLRVALNRIDPSAIRSLDTKTFEDMVVSKNTHVSKSSELPTFGVDVSRDILRAVTGEPRDTSLAKRLSGSDAVVLNVAVTPDGLPGLCDELLVAYREDTYQQNFAWIDHLGLVDDPAVRGSLDELLVEQLRVGDTSSTHMATPEAISWEDIHAFKIAGTRSLEYDDLDLDEYLLALGAATRDLTIEKLKSRYVSVRFSRSNDFDRRWNLYHCLISEQRLDSGFYVLIEGRWFSVSDSLVSEVDAFAAGVAPGSLVLPEALPGEAEPDYNKRVAEADESAFLLLDAQIRRPGGAASGIELCDVLASNGELVHVKRKSRSSTLSHLFAQGIVSATTFLQDGSFRDEIRAAIERTASEQSKELWLSLIPSSGERVDRAKYSVSYVVITTSSRLGNDWLPFFSKLNLMQTARQLSNLGFALHLNRVSVSQQA